MIKKYDNRVIFDAITIEFKQATSYAIVGISGVGKSTLLHMLMGIEKPTNGSICFDRQNIYDLSPHDRAYFFNRTIGIMFQSPSLINELSVCENIMLPGIIAGLSERECTKRTIFLLDYMGLIEKRWSSPCILSGGEQQRVVLARALCNRPSFLLADEPTGNLDHETGKSIADLLIMCQKEWNMGIIVSSHDYQLWERMEVMYALDKNKIKKIKK